MMRPHVSITFSDETKIAFNIAGKLETPHLRNEQCKLVHALAFKCTCLCLQFASATGNHRHAVPSPDLKVTPKPTWLHR